MLGPRIVGDKKMAFGSWIECGPRAVVYVFRGSISLFWLMLSCSWRKQCLISQGAQASNCIFCWNKCFIFSWASFNILWWLVYRSDKKIPSAGLDWGCRKNSQFSPKVLRRWKFKPMWGAGIGFDLHVNNIEHCASWFKYTVHLPRSVDCTCKARAKSNKIHVSSYKFIRKKNKYSNLKILFHVYIKLKY